MKRSYFQPPFFKFLRQLKTHNNRAWFQANKERYEREVRDPLLDFIGDLGPSLRKISKNLIVDNSPSGGSMFRIYRDTRFSKDKSPYKTHVAAQFRLGRSKDVHTPGFYLHLAPDEVFAGGGIWRPEPPVLGQIRDYLVHHPAAWKAVLKDKKFNKHCKIEGEKLVRPPKGYDPDHELIEYVKYKDYIFFTQFTEKQAGSPDFMERYVESCAAAAPYMEFLCQALMVAW
ncbi:MAG TPA: DUF2461 domain-containing protein [bacterium]|nr:DUF2461 domain-containing protein [bacterium]